MGNISDPLNTGTSRDNLSQNDTSGKTNTSSGKGLGHGTVKQLRENFKNTQKETASSVKTAHNVHQTVEQTLEQTEEKTQASKSDIRDKNIQPLVDDQQTQSILEELDESARFLEELGNNSDPEELDFDSLDENSLKEDIKDLEEFERNNDLDTISLEEEIGAFENLEQAIIQQQQPTTTETTLEDSIPKRSVNDFIQNKNFSRNEEALISKDSKKNIQGLNTLLNRYNSESDPIKQNEIKKDILLFAKAISTTLEENATTQKLIFKDGEFALVDRKQSKIAQFFGRTGVSNESRDALKTLVQMLNTNDSSDMELLRQLTSTSWAKVILKHDNNLRSEVSKASETVLKQAFIAAKTSTSLEERTKAAKTIQQTLVSLSSKEKVVIGSNDSDVKVKSIHNKSKITHRAGSSKEALKTYKSLINLTVSTADEKLFAILTKLNSGWCKNVLLHHGKELKKVISNAEKHLKIEAQIQTLVQKGQIPERLQKLQAIVPSFVRGLNSYPLIRKRLPAVTELTGSHEDNVTKVVLSLNELTEQISNIEKAIQEGSSLFTENDTRSKDEQQIVTILRDVALCKDTKQIENIARGVGLGEAKFIDSKQPSKATVFKNEYEKHKDALQPEVKEKIEQFLNSLEQVEQDIKNTKLPDPNSIAVATNPIDRKEFISAIYMENNPEKITEHATIIAKELDAISKLLIANVPPNAISSGVGIDSQHIANITNHIAYTIVNDILSASQEQNPKKSVERLFHTYEKAIQMLYEQKNFLALNFLVPALNNYAVNTLLKSLDISTSKDIGDLGELLTSPKLKTLIKEYEKNGESHIKDFSTFTQEATAAIEGNPDFKLDNSQTIVNVNRYALIGEISGSLDKHKHLAMHDKAPLYGLFITPEALSKNYVSTLFTQFNNLKKESETTTDESKRKNIQQKIEQLTSHPYYPTEVNSDISPDKSPINEKYIALKGDFINFKINYSLPEDSTVRFEVLFKQYENNQDNITLEMLTKEFDKIKQRAFEKFHNDWEELKEKEISKNRLETIERNIQQYKDYKDQRSLEGFMKAIKELKTSTSKTKEINSQDIQKTSQIAKKELRTKS